jgi:hypothetical protein
MVGKGCLRSLKVIKESKKSLKGGLSPRELRKPFGELKKQKFLLAD